MPTTFPLDTQAQFVGGAEDNERTVSSLLNDGSIASGASKTFWRPTWLATGPTPARVTVEDEALANETEHTAELVVLSEAPNVKYPEYGAVGDGVADDTAALQAWVTAVVAAGGVGVCPPGTYLISSTVTVAGRCELRFDKATIKKSATATGFALSVSGNDATIKNLILEGNRVAGALGGGVEWLGARGRMEDTKITFTQFSGVSVNDGNADLTCINVECSDNVSTTSAADGFYCPWGVLKTYRCQAHRNDRHGFFFTAVASGSHLGGIATRNTISGARIRNTGWGTSDYFFADDNNAYGLILDLNEIAVPGESTGWSFDYVECIRTGITAANPAAQGVEMIGAHHNTFGTVIGRANNGYGLAIAGGSSYNSVGYVFSDMWGATNPDPGINIGGGANFNTIGFAHIRHHTFGCVLGESVGNNDHNTIGTLYVEDAANCVLLVERGNYNHFGTVISRNCKSSAPHDSLIYWDGDGTPTNNTVGFLDHLAPDVADPTYLVHATSGAVNNHVLKSYSRDFVTAAHLDGGTNNTYAPVGAQGGTVTIASAATITVPTATALASITGTTTITSVAAGPTGSTVTLKFADALTFTDGSNLKLAGNFVTTADDTIALVCDGTNWHEIARSVN